MAAFHACTNQILLKCKPSKFHFLRLWRLISEHQSSSMKNSNITLLKLFSISSWINTQLSLCSDSLQLSVFDYPCQFLSVVLLCSLLSRQQWSTNRVVQRENVNICRMNITIFLHKLLLFPIKHRTWILRLLKWLIYFKCPFSNH